MSGQGPEWGQGHTPEKSGSFHSWADGDSEGERQEDNCERAQSQRLSATPRTAARQAPLCMGFPRQEHWTELPFPPPGDLPAARIQPAPPALASGLFTTESPDSLQEHNRRQLNSQSDGAGGHSGSPEGPGCKGGWDPLWPGLRSWVLQAGWSLNKEAGPGGNKAWGQE